MDELAVSRAERRPDEAVAFAYTLTPMDVFSATTAMSRHSILSGFFGFIGVLGTVLGMLVADPAAIAFALFSIGFATGVLPGNLSAGMASRRRDLLALETHVEIDATGVRMANERTASMATWSTFRRIRDTPTAFALDFGTGAGTFVPKRAMDAPERAAVRRIAVRVGKYDRASSWRWPAIGVAFGAVTTLVVVSVHG